MGSSGRCSVVLHLVCTTDSPLQVQSVLHGVPRLHQLAPEIFPAYKLPGVHLSRTRSRIETSLVSASAIPGPGRQELREIDPTKRVSAL